MDAARLERYPVPFGQPPAKFLVSVGLGPAQTVIEMGRDKSQRRSRQTAEQVEQGCGVRPAGETYDQRISRPEEPLLANGDCDA
jgi:hypothetical protein